MEDQGGVTGGGVECEVIEWKVGGGCQGVGAVIPPDHVARCESIAQSVSSR